MAEMMMQMEKSEPAGEMEDSKETKIEKKSLAGLFKKAIGSYKKKK